MRVCVCVCVCTCMCVCLSTWSLRPIVSTLSYQLLTTYGDKGAQQLCACVCVYVCVRVSINIKSTAYRIHLALPNANNLQR